MNTKVLTTLEYNKIIDLLTEKADSEALPRSGAFHRSICYQNRTAGDKRRFSPSLPYRQHLIWK